MWFFSPQIPIPSLDQLEHKKALFLLKKVNMMPIKSIWITLLNLQNVLAIETSCNKVVPWTKTDQFGWEMLVWLMTFTNFILITQNASY